MAVRRWSGPIIAAAAGSTGNNTHSAVKVDSDYNTVAFLFYVTAIGASPTVTWKFQGSIDGTNWHDVAYVTDASDTLSVATEVDTTVSLSTHFLANPVARKYRYFRLVTSSNTNVTYRADIYTV
jgi:hypothetical protein